jgi:tetratricopeptide (TPR) repeat protein
MQVAERVRVLAEKSGNLGQLVGSMAQRSFHACVAGDYTTSAALADEALELALRRGNPTTLANLYMMQVVVRFFRGDFAGAETHFAAGLKLFDDPVFRQNPNGGAIAAFGWASWNAWILGRADLARERLAKITAAVNPANPHDLPWSGLLSAQLHAFMRENETAEALAVRALDLCEKHGFPNDAAASRCLLGQVRAELGRGPDAIAMIRQALDARLQMGERSGVPGNLTVLAAAQLQAGAVDDALETIEQALNFNPQEAVGHPERLRIRGEVRLKLGGLQQAEADFRESIAMARSMGAKAWELRTTLSLARLLAPKGRGEEARTMLSEIYNWFTEGFDTADLKEAKALLDEL